MINSNREQDTHEPELTMTQPTDKLRLRLAEVMTELDSIVNDAKRRVEESREAIKAIHKRHQDAGDITTRGYSIVADPRRPGRPRELKAHSFNLETSRLNLEVVKQADLIRATLMIVNKSQQEIWRAGQATLNNAQMLLEELAKPLDSVRQAEQASNQLNQARSRERAHSQRVTEWLESHPESRIEPRKDERTMAKKTKKNTKAQAEQETQEESTRAKRVDQLSEEEKAEQIEELLETLAESEDQTEKRKIRQRLRNLGHVGGLGKRNSSEDEEGEDEAPAKKSKKSKAKPVAKKSKGKKSKKAQVEDDGDDDE